MLEYEKFVEDAQKQKGSLTKKDFVMLSVIGKGSYGKVLLVRRRESEEIYAMKVLKKAEIARRN